MARLDQLQKSVDGLRSAIPELRGVLVASTEGLPIAHSLSNGTDPARMAAMAAAATSLGRRVSDTLQSGTFEEISVAGADGQIFLYSAGNKGVLAVLGPAGCNAGLVHLEARGVARDLAEHFN
jgi:predicted regulator of Ras-like GTPase activity (Roadblock/LC7/MglB family)